MESKSKYKVSLYSCPGNLPFAFAIHPWFVVENNGVVSRWEVAHIARKSNVWKHLYRNFLPPTQGIGMLPYIQIPAWKSTLLGSIEGDENSAAERMVKFIENSPNTYAYRDTYSLLGPNSNTYVQWVLNNFPELKVSLPANAIGKNYGR